MKADVYTRTGVPVIRGTNISETRAWKGDWVFIPETFADEMPRCVVRAGALVLPHRGSIGEVAIVPSDGIDRYFLSSSLMKVEINTEVADNLFVYYYLKSPLGRNEILRFASQVGTPGIGQPLQSLRQFQIPFPTVEVQRAVSSLLASLDDKIDLNRRANETLEAMARAIFKDWFVHYGPTRAKMEGRSPYLVADLWALFPDRLDEQGKPEEWTFTVLEDVLAELETGLRPKGGVASYRSGVPSVGAESIVGLGIFDFSKTKYVPREFFVSMNRGHVQSRDILLYKDGGRPGEFEPHLTLFGDGFPFNEFAINEHVYRLRADDAVGQPWLFFWLSSDLVMEEMRVKGTGVAIPGLNSTQVKTLTTLLPNPALVGRFNDAAEPLVTRVLSNCVEMQTLAATRDLLLPKLMSGEIRIRDAEKIVEAAA